MKERGWLRGEPQVLHQTADTKMSSSVKINGVRVQQTEAYTRRLPPDSFVDSRRSHFSGEMM
eukprot:245866-Prorocentrum_minimum.AAC.2